MKQSYAILLAVTLAAIAAPAAKAQPVTMLTCVGMEGLYPAPPCRDGIPMCSIFNGMSACKLSRRPSQRQRYSSRCTNWYCFYPKPF
jgi:hypothetical protein